MNILDIEVATATRQISDILRDLERKTGRTVINLGLSKIEVTNIGSNGSEFISCVEVNLSHLPGDFGVRA